LDCSLQRLWFPWAALSRSYYQQKVVLEAGAGLAFLTGAAAVTGLAWGCILMVRETQLAVHSLEEEARIRTSQKTGNPK
jgi:predicted Kef-type K+ transport protein